MPLENKDTTDIQLNSHFLVLSVRATTFYLAYNQNLTIEEIESLRNALHKEITYNELNIGTTYNYQNNNLQVRVGMETHVLLNNTPLATLKAEYTGDFICQNVDVSELSLTDFATQNAPAIVYPYLRQGVNFLTYQAGFPPLVLPVLMMKKAKT